jgi:hypothetical protein
MSMIFSKKRMVARLKAEGHGDEIGDEANKVMDNLDGQPASTMNWQRMVHGEPLLWCTGKDGKGFYVNEADCI